MSIEEIAAKISKNDWQLFNELAVEVEAQAPRLDALVAGQKTFRRISAEAFALNRASVEVIASRRPGMLAWNRLETFSPEVLPKKDSGTIELGMGAYWLHGKKFFSTTEAALWLIDLMLSS